MLLRLFNTNHPIVYLYLLIYALLLKGSFFFIPYIYDFGTSSLLSDELFQFFSENSNWKVAYHSLSIFLVFIQALAFNQILILNRFTSLQTYIPALIFLTLSSLRPELIVLSPVNLSYLLVLPFFYNIFQLPYKNDAVETMFYSAFFISLASLLYFPSSYFLLVLIFALIWLKNPTGREVVMPFIAFLLPYFFIGVYFFVWEDLNSYWHLLYELIPTSLTFSLFSPGVLILAGLVFILVLAGYFKAIRTPQQDVILYRSYLGVLLFAIILGLAVFFLVEGDKLLMSYLLLVPLSFFIGGLFDVERPGFFLRLLFWGLILLSAFFQWNYYASTIGKALF